MTPQAMPDLDYMIEALREAELAYERGESPVGAVMVCQGEIIARAGNQVYRLQDPTAHAEILVIRQAGQHLSKVRFPDSVVYTTMQPCPMCENALIQAKVPRVVYGGSGFKHIYAQSFAKSRLEQVGPLMQEGCRGLFIQWLRNSGRQAILDAEGI